jgi:hypothetical protein
VQGRRLPFLQHPLRNSHLMGDLGGRGWDVVQDYLSCVPKAGKEFAQVTPKSRWTV